MRLMNRKVLHKITDLLGLEIIVLVPRWMDIRILLRTKNRRDGTAQ